MNNHQVKIILFKTFSNCGLRHWIYLQLHYYRFKFNHSIVSVVSITHPCYIKCFCLGFLLKKGLLSRLCASYLPSFSLWYSFGFITCGLGIWQPFITWEKPTSMPDFSPVLAGSLLDLFGGFEIFKATLAAMLDPTCRRFCVGIANCFYIKRQRKCGAM